MDRIPHRQLIKIRIHLKLGGVIAYPTESCYGLGCDPFNIKALKKILTLKKRSKTKGMIVIAGQKSHFKNILLPLTNHDLQQLNQYWPGKYSIILPCNAKLPRQLTGKHDRLAARVTQHSLVCQLTNYLHFAIVSTSANKSGHKAISNYRECLRQFGRSVMIIKGNTMFAKTPSTIIDWETKNTLR